MVSLELPERLQIHLGRKTLYKERVTVPRHTNNNIKNVKLIEVIVMFLKKVFKLLINELLLVLIAVLLYSVLVWELSDDHENDEIYPNKDEKTEERLERSKNPVIVWWTEKISTPMITCHNNIRCDIYRKIQSNKVGAYVFYASRIQFDHLPVPRRPETIWGLFHEESPRNKIELLHEPALRLFNFSSTFSRHSDVPFPLLHMKSLELITSTNYFVSTPIKNSLLENISPIIYLQSDCQTSSERDDYVKKLMEFIKIDSYGACVKNKKLPLFNFDEPYDFLNNLYHEEFLTFIARYKFAIAIENGVCHDYVTEKFWRPIHVGTVPIYFGSPTIRDWMPNDKSAILLQDFPTPELMSEHLKKLMLNDSLYEEYLEHKTKGIISNEKLMKEFKARPYQTNFMADMSSFLCLICEKLHNKNSSEVNIISKSHYNCPKPISALTLNVNAENEWVKTWESAKHVADVIYESVSRGLGFTYEYLRYN